MPPVTSACWEQGQPTCRGSCTLLITLSARFCAQGLGPIHGAWEEERWRESGQSWCLGRAGLWLWAALEEREAKAMHGSRQLSS